MVALNLVSPAKGPVHDFETISQNCEEWAKPDANDACVQLIDALFEVDPELAEHCFADGGRITNTYIVQKGADIGRSLLTLVAADQVEPDVGDLIIKVAHSQARQGDEGCYGPDGRGDTPIGLIAAAGEPQDLNRLAGPRGYGVNVVDRSGRTPLMIAAELGREAMVAHLLNLGADPLQQADAVSPTALSLATAIKDGRISETLLLTLLDGMAREQCEDLGRLSSDEQEVERQLVIDYLNILTASFGSAIRAGNVEAVETLIKAADWRAVARWQELLPDRIDAEALAALAEKIEAAPSHPTQPELLRLALLMGIPVDPGNLELWNDPECAAILNELNHEPPDPSILERYQLMKDTLDSLGISRWWACGRAPGH